MLHSCDNFSQPWYLHQTANGNQKRYRTPSRGFFYYLAANQLTRDLSRWLSTWLRNTRAWDGMSTTGCSAYRRHPIPKCPGHQYLASGQSCSGSDHAASSCAWKPTTPQATPPSQTPPLQANFPGQLRPSIKRSLNKVEHCPFAGGKFSHKCQTMGHPEYQCPSKLRQTVRLSLTCVYTC